MTVEEKIREASEKQLKAKYEKEEESLKKKLDFEKEVVNQILTKIREGSLYKKTKDSYWNHIKYESVTEETFLQDYLSEPKSSWMRKGVYQKETDAPWNGVYEVSGITYYDICWLLNDYEKAIEGAKRRLDDVLKRLGDLKCEYEAMQDMAPGIKQMLLDWQEKRNAITGGL